MPDLRPPDIPTEEAYRAVFTDTAYWSPYIDAALQSASQPKAEKISLLKPGTNPVFLTEPEPRVVKLFTPMFGGLEHRDNEVKALRALNGKALAPRLLADGVLFPAEPWPWPYAILERLSGKPLDTLWSDLRRQDQRTISQQIGTYLQDLHSIDPDTTGLDPDGLDALMAGQRTRLEEELRAIDLPQHLIDSADPFVDENLPPNPDRVLLHGDLTAEHFLVDDSLRITGVIDYGDSKIGHPAYDLIVLHIDLFEGDPESLGIVLDAYGPIEWEPEQVLAMTLCHQWGRYLIRDLPGLREASTWRELAHRLFRPSTIRP